MNELQRSEQYLQRRHVPALDGLRAFAAIAVVLFHIQEVGYFRSLPVLDRLAAAGWLGVDVFFTLSGFLITWILLQEWETSGEVRVWNFYVRRFLRLLPAYGVFLLVTASVILTLGSEPQRADLYRALPSLLTYTSNFAAASGVDLPLSLHTWSLAVEEQFYLVFPLVFLVMTNLRRFATGLALVVGSIVSVRWIGMDYWPFAWPSPGQLDGNIYFLTPFRIDSVLIGCLAATLLRFTSVRERLEASRAGGTVWIGVWLVWLYSMTAFASRSADQPLFRFGLPIIYTFTALVIVGLLLDRPIGFVRILSLPPLVQIGKISYGIYLLHVLTINVFEEVLDRTTLDGDAYALALTVSVILGVFVAAGLQYRYIERPFLKLKQRY